ncbi:copper homeostasis protein CutC [Actinocorallia longicatena]|uniref:Copper homeostasis protein cutC homolog n=1 Tax=Actinocorallia longicatena TaxID=111803 RepID=A0ABP6QBP0_9ACTN
MLEVIALTVADAVAAERGGADRLEVVADMAADGLTPGIAEVAEIRAAVSLPIRAMLRANAGFATDARELDRLRAAAAALAEAGADGFVFGFVEGGRVDLAATRALAEAVSPLPWTFHRAVDRAAGGWDEVRGLPGLDQILTSGSTTTVRDGLATLLRRAEADAALILAGGGLGAEDVPGLLAAGVTGFHVGGAVREGRSWDAPIDPGLVATWKSLTVSG